MFNECTIQEVAKRLNSALLRRMHGNRTTNEGIVTERYIEGVVFYECLAFIASLKASNSNDRHIVRFLRLGLY